MRANMDAFGKTKPLTVADFASFEKAFGKDPLGKTKRKDEGEEGRFRFFTRKEIAAKNDSLDIVGVATPPGAADPVWASADIVRTTASTAVPASVRFIRLM